MKTTYILGAILVCSIVGILLPTRVAKSILLVSTGVLAAYGLFRLLG